MSEDQIVGWHKVGADALKVLSDHSEELTKLNKELRDEVIHWRTGAAEADYKRENVKLRDSNADLLQALQRADYYLSGASMSQRHIQEMKSQVKEAIKKATGD